MRASSLDRLMACTGELYLPHNETRSVKTIAAGEYGTACHEFIQTWEVPEDIHNAGYSAKLRRKLLHSPGSERKLRELYRGAEGPTETVFVENHFVYDPKNRVARTYNGGDWYGYMKTLPDWYITGTADYILLDQQGIDGGTMLVDDLKTGMPPSMYSWQLRFYAAVAWKIFDPDEVSLSVTGWKFYPLAGLPNRRVRKVPRAELEESLDKFEELADRVIAGDKTQTYGKQCFFCQAKGACEAYAEATQPLDSILDDEID